MDFETVLKIVRSLLTNKEGSALRKILEEINVVDIASIMTELEPAERLRLFRIMPKDMSADVFAYLDSDIQTDIVKMISDREVGNLVNELFIADAVDFLEEVPANIVSRVLKQASPETRAQINEFLNYPESSAGSIMTSEMVQLRVDMTAKDAIDFIRKNGLEKETVYTCYCTDSKHTLLGALPLLHLLLCDENALVGDIMQNDKQLISVNTHDDREEVAAIVKKYDLLSVPVVDNENRIVGIITVDDIVDVIEEEATEDFEKMANVQHLEDGYLKTGVFGHVKNRIVWLLVLMVSATFTGKLIDSFESTLSAVAGLTACIPMLTGTGGNAGTQASTLIVRGLAIGELKPSDVLKILWKELRVALICGVILGGVNVGRMILLSKISATGSHDITVFLVVSAALCCAVTVAKLIGCLLPIGAKLVHLDPALMAGPMLSTIVDLVTLIIYLTLATAFLIK